VKKALLIFAAVLLPASLPAGPRPSGCPPPQPKTPAKPTPEGRALAYLAEEVPRWSKENNCFSCHNNGDGARALYVAVRTGHTVPAKALEDTSRWLGKPERWDHNGGEGPFSDKLLARIQFGAALVEAVDAGLVKDRQALGQAAELVAQLQQKDGSWQVDADSAVGSPGTYGPALATHFARRLLRRADAKKYHDAIQKAGGYLHGRPVKTVLDAAVALLELEGSEEKEAGGRRRECLALLSTAQAKEGGWGPYPKSAPEPFDTALVVLALSRCGEAKEVKEMLRRGRAFLVETQERDGSWRETTRPAGRESYPQRLSTCGWATLALLATSGR
jgi:hypothetical protein